LDLTSSNSLHALPASKKASLPPSPLPKHSVPPSFIVTQLDGSANADCYCINDNNDANAANILIPMITLSSLLFV
jgi:hypothetical protein